MNSVDQLDQMSSMYDTAHAEATLRLVEAEVALTRARRRLYGLQRAAISGYGDAAALDQAVLACREARSAAGAARTAWRRTFTRAGVVSRGGTPSSGPVDTWPPRPAQEIDDAAPSCAGGRDDGLAPHVRFARWLAEAGRGPRLRAA